MSIENIKIEQIRPNQIALRTVNVQTEEFQGLKDSIKSRGFIGSISGRKRTDEAGETYIEITDGLHRYTAAKEVGLKEIPVDIRDLEDSDVLVHQILMNVHKVETKPVEYSRQLRRILQSNPFMTEAELATLVGKTASWIKDRLGLLKLPESVAKLVDEGKINLSNAYAIAKLNDEAPDEVANWIDHAITEAPAEFTAKIYTRVKEIKDAKRKGREAAPAEFTPTAHLRKMGVLKDELESNNAAKLMVKTYKVTDPVQAFNLAIKWALQLDDESVEAQKAKDEATKAAREDARKRKAAEKAQKKAEEAAAEAAEAAAAIEA